jgi:hypothetical protein
MFFDIVGVSAPACLSATGNWTPHPERVPALVSGAVWEGETDLPARRKGEPRRVALAQELRSRTTMPLSWNAQRLRWGREAIWPGCCSSAGSLEKAYSRCPTIHPC